ncbi:MAG: hypothetical protein ABSG96_12270 [Terracidiphilus sp.]
MASQALNQLEIELPQPFMLRDILPGPAWAPYQPQYRSSIVEIDRASKQKVEEGSCAKGFMVAVAFEAAVGLGVFGIWQLWHLIR